MGLGVRIPEELHTRVDVHCALQRMTIRQVVIGALEEKLERDQSGQAPAVPPPPQPETA